MKYKDFPTQEAVVKLSSYAFARDSVDASVFKFYSASKQVYDFINNQKTKILERIASKDATGYYRLESKDASDNFRADMLELIQKEIEFDIPSLNLAEEDFDSENCYRPKERELWLTAIEKDSIIQFSKLSSEITDR